MSGIDDDNLRAVLNALLDGVLSPERAAEMHALIESDATVRAEYESLRRVVEAVRGLPHEAAPPALQERLRTIAAAKRPAPILRWAAPLAVAAVVLVAVMLAVREDRGQRLPDEARVEKEDDAAPIADRQDAPAEKFAKFAEKLAKKEDKAKRPAGVRADRRKEIAKPGFSARDQNAKPAEKEREEAKQSKDLDDAGESDSEEAGGTLAGGKPPTAKSTKPADPVAVVQAGAAIPSSKELKTYLRALAGRRQGAIVKHLRAFGIAPSSARAKKVGRGVLVAALSTQLFDKEEARLVAGVLKLAFPLVRPDAEQARKKGEKSAGAGGGAPGPSSTATVAGRGVGGKLILQVRVTSLDGKFIRSWLDRISVVRRGRRGDRSPRVRVSRGTAGVALATRQRVELRYPLPKRVNAEEADD